MRELLLPGDPAARRAPRHVREKAAARPGPETRILHIVWDQEDGYPEGSWGFEQWSVRPYHVGQGCDGTIEENMHFVALHLLQRIGIDYRAIYREAYPEQSLEGWPAPDQAAWLADESILPPADDESLELLLHDLYDTNHRTLKDLLRTRLEGLGWLRASAAPASPAAG
jgi:hypothetical protein